MAWPVDRDANRELRECFDEVYADFQRQRSSTDDVRRDPARLRVTAASGDGLVRATVGPHGHLLELNLDPAVYLDGDADALAQKITETVLEAAERAADRVRGLASATAGSANSGGHPERVAPEPGSTSPIRRPGR